MEKDELVNLPSYENGTEPQPLTKDRRVCVFQHTYTHLCEMNPNICMLTYDFSQFRYSELMLLAKCVIGLGEKCCWLTEKNISEYSAFNIPGGLVGNGRYNNLNFTVECSPIITDRELYQRKGGMAVRITATQGPITVKIGSGPLEGLLTDCTERESSVEMCCENGRAYVKNGNVYLESSLHSLRVCISGNFAASIEKLPDASENYGSYAVLNCERSELLFTVGFSQDQEQAESIAETAASDELDKVKKYYKEMLDEWYIKTPDSDLNEAFVHARLNVEYGWFRPFGWAEALHHWISMWHMEHTAAEEWAGNAQRTAEVLRAQIERLIDGNKVPELSAPGFSRIEWGGDNHFFFRCVDHYLRMTGDQGFAEYAEPYMLRIIEQTFRQYDPVGCGAMGFGTQIGNQEDFEGTPGPGSASGIEGAYMLRVMAFVERFIGNNEKAEQYSAGSRWAQCEVHKRFWMRDIGRYAWYEDVFGQRRLEPAYHSLCYPILYEMMSDEEAISSLDHLYNRMTGPDGEAYISNHFGGHCYHNVATWGMQGGANNQAFAALAYSKLGMRQKAVRPLKYIAELTCQRYKGCFPETAREGFKAYFTPAACMFSVGIIEGIFGLSFDKTKNAFTFSPCFPEEWDKAEIALKGIRINYEKRGGKHLFSGMVKNTAGKRLLWRVPPYSKVCACSEGKNIAVHTKKCCGYFEMEIDLGMDEQFCLEVSYVPIAFAIEAAESIAEGDAFVLKTSGAEFLSIHDPCGVFDTVEKQPGEGAWCKVCCDLLKPYEKFGWFGRINFARRTFFVNLRAGEVEFRVPVHITILPEYALKAELKGEEIVVSGRRYKKTCEERAVLIFGGQSSCCNMKKDSDFQLSFKLTTQQQEWLLPGQNKARLLIGDYSQEIYVCCTGDRFTKNAVPFLLDSKQLKSPLYWGEIGRMATVPGSSLFCITKDDFLQDVFAKCKQIEAIKGIPFVLSDGFFPVSSGRERCAIIEMKGIRARKVYVLLSAFISNQHVFTEPLRMELECVKNEEYFRPVFVERLYFPGDLDIGLSGRGQYGFPTYISEQQRGGLPLLPQRGDCDYPKASAPDYPQHYLWNRRIAFQVCETVFTVVEIEMDKERELKELRIFVNDDDTAAGIYAISYI